MKKVAIYLLILIIASCINNEITVVDGSMSFDDRKKCFGFCTLNELNLKLKDNKTFSAFPIVPTSHSKYFFEIGKEICIPLTKAETELFKSKWNETPLKSEQEVLERAKEIYQNIPEILNVINKLEV